MELNKIYNEDCLKGMKRIPDKSVDMILCDLPYGTTACKWDEIIPFEPLWEQYERIIKDNGAIVLTGRQPFTSKLVVSNIKIYRYDWIWQKKRPQRFVQAKKMPLSYYENISVFYKKLPTYNPQMTEGEPYKRTYKKTFNKILNQDDGREGTVSYYKGSRYPSDIISFSNPNDKNIHPTQKPVNLFEYLIKTYTNEGETVLDNCMGSGTTAIACMNTNRNYIGFELDKEYYDKSIERIDNHLCE